jgi:hypothetical protein
MAAPAATYFAGSDILRAGRWFFGNSEIAASAGKAAAKASGGLMTTLLQLFPRPHAIGARSKQSFAAKARAGYNIITNGVRQKLFGAGLGGEEPLQ